MSKKSGSNGVIVGEGEGTVEDDEVSATKEREPRVGVGVVVDMRGALSLWRGTLYERMVILGDY